MPISGTFVQRFFLMIRTGIQGILLFMPPAEQKQARNLANQRFLITRPKKTGENRLAKLIQAGGGTTTNFPVIRLELATAPQEIETRLTKEEQNFRSIVFASSTGVQFLLESCSAAARNAISHFRLFAIGNSTAAAVREAGFATPSVPAEPNSQSLAALLTNQRQDQPFLICRAEQGSSTLAELLDDAQIRYEEWIIYRSTPVAEPDPAIAAQLARGEFDWVLLSSSQIAKQTCLLFGQALKQSKLASMSPAITEVLIACGFPPTVEANTSNFDGLLDAVARHVPE